jgi:hypothetical protein
MTKKESKLLSEIIDLNWNVSREENIMKRVEMFEELSIKKRALRDSMGHEEYDRFMDNGRKMFAPKN